MVLAVRWKSDCGQDEAQVASTGAWISAPWHGLWVDIWLVLKISGLDFNGFLPRRSGGGDPNLGTDSLWDFSWLTKHALVEQRVALCDYRQVIA